MSTDYMTGYLHDATLEVCKAILSHDPHMLDDTIAILNGCIKEGFDGKDAVAGLWLASEFIEHRYPTPFFYACCGSDKDTQSEGEESLTQNVLNKGRVSAQTGLDSLQVQNEPYHFLVIRGKYFPWGGAIIRRIGRIEFVVVVSGFTPEEDDDAARRIWKMVCGKLRQDLFEALMHADLPTDDPRRCKYPTGPVKYDPPANPDAGYPNNPAIHGHGRDLTLGSIALSDHVPVMYQTGEIVREEGSVNSDDTSETGGTSAGAAVGYMDNVMSTLSEAITALHAGPEPPSATGAVTAYLQAPPSYERRVPRL